MPQAETKHDPFVGLADAGATTSALDLRAGVAVALTRSPMTTAVAAHDLQVGSSGE